MIVNWGSSASCKHTSQKMNTAVNQWMTDSSCWWIRILDWGSNTQICLEITFSMFQEQQLFQKIASFPLISLIFTDWWRLMPTVTLLCSALQVVTIREIIYIANCLSSSWWKYESPLPCKHNIFWCSGCVSLSQMKSLRAGQCIALWLEWCWMHSPVLLIHDQTLIV